MNAKPPTRLRPPSGGRTSGDTARGIGLETGVGPLVRRRLATAALIYTACYTLAFTYGAVQQVVEHGRNMLPTSSYVVAAIAIAIGVGVFLVARSGQLPAARLWTVAVVFEVVGALGIIGGAWGWERDADRHYYASYRSLKYVIENGEAVPEERLAQFRNEAPSAEEREAYYHEYIDPLVAMKERLLRHEGVGWIGVWILIFPLILPASPGRILFGSIASATAPLILILSSAMVNGLPYSLRAWFVPFLTDFFVPIYICVGIAYFAARTLHGLRQNLSRAQRLGSYQLVDRIGEGSMGEVWRARHDLLARPAAIKLIKLDALSHWDEEDGRTAFERFEREAQATAALGSPHSVELYDFGVTRDGAFYYVMELLNGLDLRTLVERHGPLPAERVLHLARQACHSLTDAHRSGLIHRDVKPANIFACLRGHEYDFVKVLDFGLVKEMHTPDRSDVQLTSRGAMCGTPAFIAPELVAGKRPDARADLYSLGCVIYWMLTGELVFDGDTPVAILVQHMQATPVPPSARTDAGVPEPVDRLVLSCLAKDPDARPESASALATELERVAGELEPWTPGRAEEWWQRVHPEVAAAETIPVEVEATLPVA